MTVTAFTEAVHPMAPLIEAVHNLSIDEVIIAQSQTIVVGQVLGHERADAVERVGGDASAVAQAARELAVVDRAASEGRFRDPGAPAVVGNLAQDGVVHGAPTVIARRPKADEAIQDIPSNSGLLRRYAPRNDAWARRFRFAPAALPTLRFVPQLRP